MNICVEDFGQDGTFIERTNAVKFAVGLFSFVFLLKCLFDSFRTSFHSFSFYFINSRLCVCRVCQRRRPHGRCRCHGFQRQQWVSCFCVNGFVVLSSWSLSLSCVNLLCCVALMKFCDWERDWRICGSHSWGNVLNNQDLRNKRGYFHAGCDNVSEWSCCGVDVSSSTLLLDCVCIGCLFIMFVFVCGVYNMDNVGHCERVQPRNCSGWRGRWRLVLSSCDSWLHLQCG